MTLSKFVEILQNTVIQKKVVSFRNFYQFRVIELGGISMNKRITLKSSIFNESIRVEIGMITNLA